MAIRLEIMRSSPCHAERPQFELVPHIIPRLKTLSQVDLGRSLHHGDVMQTRNFFYCVSMSSETKYDGADSENFPGGYTHRE